MASKDRSTYPVRKDLADLALLESEA